MNDLKDNFSDQSDHYFKFRPKYPEELRKLIAELVENPNTMWDVGTGNGQLAILLSELFKEIYATDISKAQLQNAVQRPNIHYSKQLAERTDFEPNQFDLITVAQAIHWFNFDAFYKEVNRTLKKDGLLVVIGYGLVRINETIDHIIDWFYHELVGPYWDSERSYLDDGYATIPFPFDEIKLDTSIKLESKLSLQQLLGYLKSWSAVQHYIKENGSNPVDQVELRLSERWKTETLRASHPLFIRIGKNGEGSNGFF